MVGVAVGCIADEDRPAEGLKVVKELPGSEGASC